MVEAEPLTYFVLAQQPDIVNTLAINDATVSNPVTIMTITSAVVEDKTAAISPATDTINFICSADVFPGVVGKF